MSSALQEPLEQNLVEALERALDRGVVLDPWLFADGHGARLAGKAIRIEQLTTGADRCALPVSRRVRRPRG